MSILEETVYYRFPSFCFLQQSTQESVHSTFYSTLLSVHIPHVRLHKLHYWFKCNLYCIKNTKHKKAPEKRYRKCCWTCSNSTEYLLLHAFGKCLFGNYPKVFLIVNLVKCLQHLGAIAKPDWILIKSIEIT